MRPSVGFAGHGKVSSAVPSLTGHRQIRAVVVDCLPFHRALSDLPTSDYPGYCARGRSLRLVGYAATKFKRVPENSLSGRLLSVVSMCSRYTSTKGRGQIPQ